MLKISIIICAILLFFTSGDKDVSAAHLLPEVNVASPEYQPKIITGTATNHSDLFGDAEPKKLDGSNGFVYHSPNEKEGITVELNSYYYINHVRFRLYDVSQDTYFYSLEVSADGATWFRVINHSQLPCQSWQYLYFPPRIVKFIRVAGTKFPVNNEFDIIKLQAMFINNSFS